MLSHIEEIDVQIADHIAVVTLNRPAKLNSVTIEMSEELERLITEMNDDDDVRVVVLTGAGEKAFCVGSDISGLDSYTSPWHFRNRTDYCNALRALRKPIIAAINGYALGGGLETCLISDIRIASKNARFSAPEIKLGWVGGGGVAAGLLASMGSSNAAMMLFTGEMIDAQLAYECNLVSEVTEPEDLLPAAMRIAQTIAALPPIAVQTAKANLQAALNMPYDQAVQYERDLQTVTFATADAAEGRAAFAEKRAPEFHGR